MTVKELHEFLTKQIERDPRSAERIVKVPIEMLGAVGGTPAVEIVGAYGGFDWDNGVYFLKPKEALLQTTTQEIERQRRALQSLDRVASVIYFSDEKTFSKARIAKACKDAYFKNMTFSEHLQNPSK